MSRLRSIAVVLFLSACADHPRETDGGAPSDARDGGPPKCALLDDGGCEPLENGAVCCPQVGHLYVRDGGCSEPVQRTAGCHAATRDDLFMCGHATLAGCYVSGDAVWSTSSLWAPGFVADNELASCDPDLQMEVSSSPRCGAP